MKDLKQKNKEFFDKIAKYYDNKLFSGLLLNPIRKTVKSVDIKKDSKILDAGCGTGNLLKILEDKKINLKLWGIDLSPEMIKIARKKVRTAEIRLGSVEKLDFKKNYFGYIFSIDAFHHYYGPDLAIKNFSRVLKKGGSLIISDFSFGNFFNKIYNKIEPGNAKMRTPSDLKNLFREYKFKNIKQKKIGLFNILVIGRK